jgi:glycosyltransferase involved in cell wall biosynthesis
VRLAYLFSRYPVVSQTFCDTEILALERMGVELELYSIYPPPTSFRHGHAARMKAEIHYAPPGAILKLHEAEAKSQGRWPEALIAEHDRRFGKEYKAALRARNALYFADLFRARGLTHFHVHFANRAAHTALFVKEISGLPFSISTHGQDFMSDLGSDDLLREICRGAEFVANETEFSKGLVAQLCPDSAGKMLRVFNGMELANFRREVEEKPSEPVRIVSIGRLIEFKGFHHLIPACAELKKQGRIFTCEIIGEGPWRGQLAAQIEELGMSENVRLLGSLPQEEVFQKLRSCDIFALACARDKLGATDVFPTVILEAMASARPVVSTRLAGVPEQIVHEETGLLVEPGTEAELAEALRRLIDSDELRSRMGAAGRARLETEFAVEETVKPLYDAFQAAVKPASPPVKRPAGAACLLREWPATDPVESELRQLLAATPQMPVYTVLAGSGSTPKDAAKMLPHLHFFPDAMVLEGEWQQERGLARRIETWRVELGQKLSSEHFLQSAREALYLRRWIARYGIRHVHVTSSRELLCVWLLNRLCGVSYSVTVEPGESFLPRSVVIKLAGEAISVRIPSEEVATEFSKANPSAARASFHRYKPGRSLEPEWLTQFATWGEQSGSVAAP